MWIEVRCGGCGTGRYEARTPLVGWTCTECGHVIAASDLTDVDDWRTRDGFLVVLDLSY
ncbi:hypothetical protein [Streptomyces sp. NPDC056061]|uniref:hypothetical protein n=1 Tax=Streptomyces sp. NPDC056061 TaxID=3345700 RepID=UPI0035DCBEDB